MSTENRFRALSWKGIPSRRSFTLKELQAAKDLGYAGRRGGKWVGTVFWAKDPRYLDDLRKLRESIDILLPAWEREWENWKNQ